MSSDENYIIKDQELEPAEDYYHLRKEGVAHIEKLSSDIWTDYNVHDPGITTLEVLCYALTDLGYRTSFKIEDLLARQDGSSDFFTARQIMTVNPTTLDDLRKLIIDTKGVKNAWLQLSDKQEKPFWLNCDKSILTFEDKEEYEQINIKGLYDVILELDEDELAGDLNDYSLEFTYQEIEFSVNFPGWEFFFNKNLDPKEWHLEDFNYIRYIFNTKIHEAEIILKKGSTTISLPVTFVISGPRKIVNEDKIKLYLESSGSSAIWDALQLKVSKALAIVALVYLRTHQYRNLCEDFKSYKEIDIEDIILCADIEVSPESSIEAIDAEIIYQVRQYLAPDIRFYSLKELLRLQKKTVNIFNGPALEHGFILNEDLQKATIRKFVYTSDLVNIIMDIDGVIAIKKFELASKYKGITINSGEKWCLEIGPNRAPRLHISDSKLIFFKGLLPYQPYLSKTLKLLKEKELSQRKGKLAAEIYDIEPPKGSYLPLADYSTIQNDFPLTYGIGIKGIPGLVDDRRKSQAKQFKAFLTLYDQLLANYLAQLANVSRLFSHDSAIKRTYFYQVLYQLETPPDDPEFVIDEVPEYYKLIRRFVEGLPVDTDLDDFSNIKSDWQVFKDNFNNDFITTLAGIVEDKDTFLDRRNRFLDHLMARFAEQFTDYVLLLFQLEGKEKAQAELIEDKQAFLQSYPEISRDRGRAFNKTDCDNLWDTNNVAGLVKRLSKLTGIKDFSRRYLHCHLAENLFQVFKDTAGEWRFNLKNNDGDIILKSEGYTQKASCFKAIDSVLRNGDEIELYEPLISSDGKFYFNLKAKNHQIIGTTNLYAAEDERDSAISGMIELIEEMCEDEGLHLVEHVLLRPFKASYDFLPVCVEKGCKSCLGFQDPYSFRITLVLPAWVKRFKSMDFRRFFEELAHKETPAHIHVKICWVDHSDMKLFEYAFHKWLKSQCTNAVNEAMAQRKLINALAEIRSVYPVATLHDCREGEDENPLILGNTVLGSTKLE